MKPFITINFGAGSLKMAEFDVADDGRLQLLEYGVKPLGMEGALESKREATLLKAIQELMSERNFIAKEANIVAPGFQVFSKFVKLPPVDTTKATQIIQYEAQQNVPFPLEEVVWDYQITGTSASGELEVLLVAIKSDIVEGLFRVCDNVGYHINMVDAAPAALCNAFRYNYGDLEGCTLLLDIGSKTSNALLFENGKFYSRSINIGANNITQDFAAESKLRFNEAEATKITEGFVSLGGAYAEPENKHQAAISKIARQVMTRLHIQVNQTIQFYKSQQGGSMPDRVLLSGGATVMPYTVEFFAEKLKIEVDYFNPLRNINIAPGVDLEHLSTVAHSFGELVGTGLKNLAECPVEVNLMPKTSRQKQEFGRKKPYLIAAFGCLVAAIAVTGLFFGNAARQKQAAIEEITAEVQPLAGRDTSLKRVTGEIESTLEKTEQLINYREQQKLPVHVFSELQKAFRKTELDFSQNGVNAGVWIKTLSMGELPKQASSSIEVSSTEDDSAAGPTAEQASMEAYRALIAQRYGDPAAAASPEPLVSAEDASLSSTNDAGGIKITCEAINLVPWTSDNARNTSFAFALLNAIQQNELFDAENTRIQGSMVPAKDSDLTFSFQLSVKLSNPIEL